MKRFLRGAGWFAAFLLTTLAAIILALYLIMWLFVNGPSPSARKTFVATMLETGGLKFVISWYLTDEEVLKITDRNDDGSENIPVVNLNLETDASADSISPNIPAVSEEIDKALAEDPDGDGFVLLPIKAHTFAANLLIIKDPSCVKLSSSYPWSGPERDKNGLTVGEHCIQSGAFAGINAGEYVTSGTNWGGLPVGVVVEDGKILFNGPSYGDVMVGFDKDNKLIVKELGGMGAGGFEAYVKEHGIRDAASFKDISGGNINHFTKLIIDGEPVTLGGRGAGANPRTAIGQCADGTVLFLCTDGRGTGGHLGATGEDLINVMMKYGAVTAANLDGGSSSSLYFDGDYSITSTHMRYADTSRRVPTAFVAVKKEDSGE